MSDQKGTCEACGRPDQDLFVYALTGAPMTVSTCSVCASLGAYPYGALVGRAIGSGYPDHAADWFKDVVISSLAVTTKTLFDFLEDVKQAEADYAKRTS